MTAHSLLGGSKAHVWGNCAGHVQMVRDLPEQPTSIPAEEGTAAHEIGALLIKDAAVGRSLTWKDFDGRSASNGVPFTEEMFEAAEIYADDVIAVMRSTGTFGGPSLLIEELIQVPRIHETAFGTPDAAIFHENKLYLWDFKSGHRYVDPFENQQAVFYFAGLLDRFGIDGAADQFIEVEFRIVSPRVYRHGGPVHSWKTTTANLRPLINHLESMAAAQFEDDPKCTIGPHCGDCPAMKAMACPAALAAGASLYEAAITAKPMAMEPAALGLQAQIIKRALEHLKDLDAAIDEQVLGLIRNGQAVPGWGAEQGYGRERWTIAAPDAIAMAAAYGVDISKPGVLTPNQAIKAGLDAETVRSVTERPKGSLKLVPDDGTKVAKVFS